MHTLLSRPFTPAIRSALGAVGLSLGGCTPSSPKETGGDYSVPADTATEEEEEETTAGVVVPTGGEALLPWLEAGTYRDWPAEAAIHESAGPHFGDVRTFLSPDLADSLSSGGVQHPLGSAAVKELYGGGTEIDGYAVMVRTGEAAGGDNWYWLEVYGVNTYADGEGVSLCTGCHSGGIDFVLTPWPQ